MWLAVMRKKSGASMYLGRRFLSSRKSRRVTSPMAQPTAGRSGPPSFFTRLS